MIEADSFETFTACGGALQFVNWDHQCPLMATLGWYRAGHKKAHFMRLHSPGHFTAACGVGVLEDPQAVRDDDAPRCKRCESALARGD